MTYDPDCEGVRMKRRIQEQLRAERGDLDMQAFVKQAEAEWLREEDPMARLLGPLIEKARRRKVA